MYAVNILEKSTIAKYENFTFPSFRYVLENTGTEKSLVAIAASDKEQPAGLALAKINEDDISKAEVLSIFVEPQNRCLGIGTALLERLEKELIARGCKQAELTYTTGKPTTSSLEGLLQKRNWTVPFAKALVCKGNAEIIMEAPWMKRYSRLPSEYSIFPWLEITQEERETIQRKQEAQPWIPEGLVPFKHEKYLEPLNSLGLRYQGEVVGWVINHRLSPETIRYTCSFVRKDLQKMGRIISLYSEAGKRQLQANIPNVIWTVPTEHESMIKFVKHYWTSSLTSVNESRISFKSFEF
ncbi:MAG: GNAT family N-acetyltransferase [Scytonematopsis contorta HA4267-MV1]|nr:GNAT family N-acetyltransferase [Scytonematopsis contorta HA4267-MV1]